MKSTPALMIQGTGSDVGKSLLVAGLGRAFRGRGLAVRPFKPQNMSNNAAIAGEGFEIGRAQALQARACGIAPSPDMNPVLLKPQSECGAQIVVNGRVAGSATAEEYQIVKRGLMPAVLDSFARLSGGADLILVEGAGSAAEVNLRDGDIANMGFAAAADLPVVLVGDIERGGVIASLVGTHTLLPAEERARLKGYIVNKFWGDTGLFGPALATIARHTGLDCLGIVPFFADAARLPAEDTLALGARPASRVGAIRIAVPRLPRIANFDDLDPLAAEPDVVLEFVEPGRPLPPSDAVILPGSKSTLADLAALREAGWDIDILAHHRRGGAVLGLCAGFQMLGRSIADPAGIEGRQGAAAGLGLLAIDTIIAPAKVLREAEGTDRASGQAVRGYEMHMGRSEGPGLARPMLTLAGAAEGAVSEDGRVAGCYLHGLFAADGFRHAWLAGFRDGRRADTRYEATIEAALDGLAAHLARHLDLDRLLEIARAR